MADGNSAFEVFRICREEIKHEQDVLANRVNTYIVSQSFLVTAYAVSLGNLNPVWGASFRLIFPLTLSLAGLLLSLQAYPGLAGAAMMIDHWHDRQYRLLDEHPELKAYETLRNPSITRANRRSLLFAHASPWIFGSLWVLLAFLALGLHTLG